MNTQTLFRVVVIAQSVLPDPGYTQVWSAYNRVWHLVSGQWGFLGTSAGKESACNAGDPSSIPGLGRSPGEGIGYPPPKYSWVSLVAQTVMNPPIMQETWVWSLGWEDPLEEDTATHSSILAWRIPMDRGVWRATVHGMAESQTRLSN